MSGGNRPGALRKQGDPNPDVVTKVSITGTRVNVRRGWMLRLGDVVRLDPDNPERQLFRVLDLAWWSVFSYLERPTGNGDFGGQIWPE